MPRGEPTKTVRLPLWLVEQMQQRADASGVTLPAYLTRKLAASPPGQQSGSAAASAVPRRCSCTKPVLSKYASNICTACGLTRG